MTRSEVVKRYLDAIGPGVTSGQQCWAFERFCDELIEVGRQGRIAEGQRIMGEFVEDILAAEART